MKSSTAYLSPNLSKSTDKQVAEGHISDQDSKKKTISTTQTTWLGKENCDWDCPDNWTNGIPSRYNHAYISAAAHHDNFPVLTGNLNIDFTIKNSGRFTIENTIEILPKGLIQNEGTIEITNFGTLINYGKILNLETIQNRGTIMNEKIIINEGSLIDEGVLSNRGDIRNFKELLNNGFVATENGLVGEKQVEGMGHVEIYSGGM